MLADTQPQDKVTWYRSLSKEQRRIEIDKFCDQLRQEISAARIEIQKPKLILEKDIETSFANHLENKGIRYRRQVSCAAGIIDILTTDTIYEVKLNLTRDNIFEAVGQAMIYRECVMPWARIVIVGIAAKDTEKLIPYVSSLGIEVISWNV